MKLILSLLAAFIITLSLIQIFGTTKVIEDKPKVTTMHANGVRDIYLKNGEVYHSWNK